MVGGRDEHQFIFFKCQTGQCDSRCGIAPYRFKEESVMVFGKLFQLVDCQEILFCIGYDELLGADVLVAGDSKLEKGGVIKEFDELLWHECPADRPETGSVSSA